MRFYFVFCSLGKNNDIYTRVVVVMVVMMGVMRWWVARGIWLCIFSDDGLPGEKHSKYTHKCTNFTYTQYALYTYIKDIHQHSFGAYAKKKYLSLFSCFILLVFLLWVAGGIGVVSIVLHYYIYI